MSGPTGALRAAEVAYRMALRLYPRSFRERFGAELLRTFRDGARDALAERGVPGLVLFWARCVGDAVAEGLRVRFRGETFLSRDAFVRDVRDAWRGLRRRPATAAVAVLTLTLGVGANAAIFTVVRGVVLRPFAYPDAHELVVLQDRSLDGGRPFRTTGGAYLAWREGSRTLEDVALMGGYTTNLTEPGLDPERVEGGVVSESFFDVLGVRPALGRTFRPEEMRGSPRVMILSDALWRGRYGADPDVVGGTVTANGEAWEVVGVMPPVPLPVAVGDVSLVPADARRVWVPLDFDREWVEGFRSHIFVALGRLRSDATLEAAAAEVEAVTAGVRERHPDLYGRLASDTRPLRDVVLGDVRRDLWILLGAVALVLAVACANLTNLLLARSVDRTGERAVRAALGAGAGRLLRLGLLEAAILGVVGGGLGVLAAVAGVDALGALLPRDLPRRAEIRVDWLVVAFTLGVSMAAALAAGLVPALRGARPPMTASLRASGRGARGAGGRLTRGLVASQIALACALLVGAGLLLRSFQALRATDLGAETLSTLDAEVVLPRSRYDTREAAVEALRRIEEAVAAVPGVTSVVLAYDTPLSGSWTETFDVVGRPPPPPGERPGSYFRPVSPNYLDQMGVRVVRGRGLAPTDDAASPGVVVVNEAFVDEHFAGEEDGVLGRRLSMGTVRGTWDDGPGEWEIVGVVEDVRFLGARRSPPDAFYYSLRQAPVLFAHLLARTDGDPRAALPGIREAVRSVDPEVPLSAVTTLAEARARLQARDRLNALLLLGFATLALVVAAAGVYGVLSHAVARRIPEMGVRLALGARPASVGLMLLGETLRVTGMGLLLGVGGALLAGRLLAGLLYEVRPWDPSVLASVVAVLLLTALVAGSIPARRASSTDPSEALRAD